MFIWLAYVPLAIRSRNCRGSLRCRVGPVARLRYRMCRHIHRGNRQLLVSPPLVVYELPLKKYFSAFRYCCSARGDKLEKTQLKYACLARVVREGGFKIALIARFSAIPGHCKCSPLTRTPAHLIRRYSHYRRLLDVWYEYLGLLHRRSALITEAVLDSLSWCCSRTIRRW